MKLEDRLVSGAAEGQAVVTVHASYLAGLETPHVAYPPQLHACHHEGNKHEKQETFPSQNGLWRGWVES